MPHDTDNVISKLTDFSSQLFLILFQLAKTNLYKQNKESLRVEANHYIPEGYSKNKGYLLHILPPAILLKKISDVYIQENMRGYSESFSSAEIQKKVRDRVDAKLEAFTQATGIFNSGDAPYRYFIIALTIIDDLFQPDTPKIPDLGFHIEKYRESIQAQIKPLKLTVENKIEQMLPLEIAPDQQKLPNAHPLQTKATDSTADPGQTKFFDYISSRTRFAGIACNVL